jgi:hypothetical protein
MFNLFVNAEEDMPDFKNLAYLIKKTILQLSSFLRIHNHLPLSDICIFHLIDQMRQKQYYICQQVVTD